MKEVLMLLGILGVLSAPIMANASTEPASVSIMGPDGIPKAMELKAIKDEPQPTGFELTADNVVSIPVNGKVSVSSNGPVSFTGAKLTPASTENTRDIPISNAEISFAGVVAGIYTLDVIVDDKFAYECIIVIGPSPQPQQVTNVITEINTQSSSTNVVKIFEDSDSDSETDEPSVCYFEPNTNPHCVPVDGECPEDAPVMNEQGNCHGGGKCPTVDKIAHERLDDDESGKCFPITETFHCPSGAIVLDSRREDCAIYEPDLTPQPTPQSESQAQSNETQTQASDTETEDVVNDEEEQAEEETEPLDSNCGGVPCTASEKEDSTTSNPIPGEPHTPTTEEEEIKNE